MAINKGHFKKGQVANPKGRPPILLPEVQAAIEANRNALKVVILSKMDGKVEEWVENIIQQGIGDADVIKFKMLMEMALGSLVTDPPEFPVSEEEKLFILELRRRKDARTIE